MEEKLIPLPVDTILRTVRHQFEKAGLPSPRLEAEVLLARFLKVDRSFLYINREIMVSEGQLKDFQALVSRRIQGEPLAYVIGSREFWSLDFKVGKGVLVPRPETEFVVENAFRFVSGQAVVVDVGTGSGIIAICLAKERPGVRFYATDLSKSALQIARINAKDHGVLSQITFLKADLVSPFAPDSIDVIVSNPPYIPTKEILTLSPEIYKFEPHSALDGGKDGLVCARRLIRQATVVLKREGVLILEMGYGQGKSLARYMERQGYEVLDIVCDYAGIERVIIGRKG